MRHTPTVLLIGVTGQLGSLVAGELQKNTEINLVIASRHRKQLDQLAQQYGAAVYLDLDKPETLVHALKNIDRVFLLTSYTVNMVTQSKIFIDAAKEAAVEHILVKLGIVLCHILLGTK